MITKRIRLVPDPDFEWWDDGYCEIAYQTHCRNCLGTKPMTFEEIKDISRQIKKGELTGLPVYAYIHGGVVLSTTPFTDPWDSGQSGYVYSRNEGVTEDALRAFVEAFNMYLAGDTWGYVAEEATTITGKHPRTGEPIERVEWTECDSCYGFLGGDPGTNGMREHAGHLLEDGFVFVFED